MLDASGPQFHSEFIRRVWTKYCTRTRLLEFGNAGPELAIGMGACTAIRTSQHYPFSRGYRCRHSHPRLEYGAH